jgi:dehydratase family protein
MDAKTTLRCGANRRKPAGSLRARHPAAHAALRLTTAPRRDGMEFDLVCSADVFKRTPRVPDLKPGGRYVAKDLFQGQTVPLLPTGGAGGLKGTRAPDGGVGKVAGLETIRLSRPACCFDGEKTCVEAVRTRRYKDDVVVIRPNGPSSGLPRQAMRGASEPVARHRTVRHADPTSIGFPCKVAEQMGDAWRGCVNAANRAAETGCHAGI